ncbi:MAG: NAD(P)H-quinone oxidoreductase [Methylococcaceae bacterium]
MTLPTTMQAIAVDSNQLILKNYPMPVPTANEVLIKVASAGVNRADVLQRQGNYPPPVGASEILGLEVSGTIVARGVQVKHLSIGDKVCALVTGGGYAQYCLASAVCCLPILENHTFEQASALPEALFTVWSNLFDRARLQAGEILLVHGGSSGIGTMAIQLGKAFGAKVIVTVGSDEKCAACLHLGADAAINYRQSDFVEAVKRLTDKQGVNVILDMVGGDYLPRNIECLANDGRLVHIALQNGIRANINLLPVMLKRLTITGSTLRARDDGFKEAIAQQLRHHVLPLLANHSIKPIIHAQFDLAEAALAHELLLSSQHIGKLILRVTHHDL